MSTSSRKSNKARKKIPDLFTNVWICENIEKSEYDLSKKIQKI